MLKIALLDDYAHVALQAADWSVLDGRAEITAFDRHLAEDEAESRGQVFPIGQVVDHGQQQLPDLPIARRDAFVDREARKGKGPSDHAPVVVDLADPEAADPDGADPAAADPTAGIDPG